MIEKKFRFWDQENHSFFEFTLSEMLSSKVLENYDAVSFMVANAEKAEQFTGLHDKNGKEIYENDILVGYDGFNDTVNGYVFFCTELGRYVVMDNLTLTGGIARACKVIANIHENPELPK